MIKNLGHNLDYIAVYCRYTIPSHFDGQDDDGLMNRADGSADGNCQPHMGHFVNKHTISANNVVSTAFDRNNSRHLLGIFVVSANCQTVHLDRYSSLRNATN